MEYTALLHRVAEIFPGLSPELRRAARFVLDRPDDVALMSMRGLARDAGVHPSTMVRLARAAGFDGYGQFREPFQHRLRDQPFGYTSRVRELQARCDERTVPRLLAEAQAAVDANLHETFGTLDEEAVQATAAALASSRRVFIMGLRSCFPIAFSFHYAYRMFRTNVRLLDGRGGTFADDLREVGVGDAVVAISIVPYTAETVRAVAYAQERGATVVALTDTILSPLATHADHTLLVSCDGPSFFGSLAAALALVEALIVLLVADGGDAALEAIEESERQLEACDAYWREPVTGAKGDEGIWSGRKG